jgi:hypothetical protein
MIDNMKQSDFEFIGLKLLQDRGASEVIFREKISIINSEGQEEDKWVMNSIKPPMFPHDDLKKAIMDLLPIFAKQCGREQLWLQTKDPVAAGIRITYFGVEQKKEVTCYIIRGLVREPAGYYNAYNPKKLDRKLKLYYDENDELPILGDVIIKESFNWVTLKKYDNSGQARLWEKEDVELYERGMVITDNDAEDTDDTEDTES